MSRAPKFRLTGAGGREIDLQASVADALNVLLMPPAFWTAFPAGHVQLPPAAAARLSRAGLKMGVPDIIAWHGGQSFGIELKIGSGRLSRTRMARTKRGSLRWVEGQEDVFPKLEAAGMRIAVCRSVDDVLAALDAWGVPLRARISA